MMAGSRGGAPPRYWMTVRVIAGQPAVLVSEEFESGLVAAAAPVRDATGTIVGAFNVSAPSFRVEGHEADLVAAVREAAADLSAAITAGAMEPGDAGVSVD